jgi:hypothetical protein
MSSAEEKASWPGMWDSRVRNCNSKLKEYQNIITVNVERLDVALLSALGL